MMYPDHDVIIQLALWRRKYAVVCELVEQINSSFGFILLCSVPYNMAEMITLLFYVVNVSQYDEDYYIDIYYVGHVLVQILLLIFSANEIDVKVDQHRLSSFS